MGDVSFVEDCRVFSNESQMLVKPFALDLCVDIDRTISQCQGTAYQQFTQALPTVFAHDCNPFKLGAIVSLPYPERACSFIPEEEQQVGARGILAVEIDGFADALFLHEDRTAYLLTQSEVRCIGWKRGGPCFQIYDSLFHSVHNIEKQPLLARVVLSFLDILPPLRVASEGRRSSL